MKAILKTLCAIFALSFSLITFNSCADDLNDVNVLIGTWMHQDNDGRDYYQFLADGTGYEWDAPLVDVPGFQPRKEKFQYVLSGSKLHIIKAYDDPDVENVKLINNNRIKIDGDVYNRQ